MPPGAADRRRPGAPAAAPRPSPLPRWRSPRRPPPWPAPACRRRAAAAWRRRSGRARAARARPRGDGGAGQSERHPAHDGEPPRAQRLGRLLHLHGHLGQRADDEGHRVREEPERLTDRDREDTGQRATRAEHAGEQAARSREHEKAQRHDERDGSRTPRRHTCHSRVRPGTFTRVSAYPSSTAGTSAASGRRPPRSPGSGAAARAASSGPRPPGRPPPGRRRDETISAASALRAARRRRCRLMSIEAGREVAAASGRAIRSAGGEAAVHHQLGAGHERGLVTRRGRARRSAISRGRAMRPSGMPVSNSLRIASVRYGACSGVSTMPGWITLQRI